MNDITLKKIYSFKSTADMLRRIAFRGVYDKHGSPVLPYKNARFSITTVYPQSSPGTSPEIKIGRKREPLFTPQPTIYENQTKVMEDVDKFLLSHDMKMSELRRAVEYSWEGRGEFHILPPVIEKHTYYLKNGYLDLPRFLQRFKGLYVKDANEKLHSLSDRYLRSFYIDEVSKIDHLDVFSSNVPIINYGLGNDGAFTFYIVCDGAHRLDYVLEDKISDNRASGRTGSYGRNALSLLCISGSFSTVNPALKQEIRKNIPPPRARQDPSPERFHKENSPL